MVLVTWLTPNRVALLTDAIKGFGNHGIGQSRIWTLVELLIEEICGGGKR